MMATTVDSGEPVARESAFETKIYGFIDAHLEKVAATPDSIDANGNTVLAPNAAEWDVPNLNVMVQGTYRSSFHYFLNLAAPGAGSPADDEPIAVRNAWVEAPLLGDQLLLRFGKTYRRFGLYNELLDAVPQYRAIEPPELFDKDHLLITRTTNLMLHGRVFFGDNSIGYSLMTGADERANDEVPIGVDLRYQLGTTVTVGTSYYDTNGKAVPTRDIGEGSPRGGVINWMAFDKYRVFGGYGKVSLAGLVVEAEGWRASHDAERDPARVIQLTGAGLNPRQAARFGIDGASPTEADVIVPVKYDVDTGYVSVSNEFLLGRHGTLTPYARLDYYSNPETINDKDFGGDNEAGLTDDGKFIKSTIGVAWRPAPAVAFKVDSSTHTQKFNGDSITYPEIRFSLSYQWEL